MFSIVIATKHEYLNLQLLLPVLLQSYPSADMLVLDDTSNDGTEELCTSLGIRYAKQKSSGKGGALREAAEMTYFPYLVFFDGDCSHNPQDIGRLVRPIMDGHFKHVSGSRMLGGSRELFNEPGHSLRLIGTLITNYLLTVKFKFLVTDAQNGLRAFDVKFLKSLALTSKFFSIELEMVAKTLSKGEPILELSTHEYKRINGQSKIQLVKHGILYFFALLKALTLKTTAIKAVNQNIIELYDPHWLKGPKN
jgi:glycosyltransferase involved in cell wall biosynthesis